MSIVEAIFAVFSAIGDWFVGILPSFYSLFWVAETGLTLLGTLAVISIGIGLVFLLIGVITNFIKLRN